MRDEDALDRSLQSFAPMQQPAYRQSLLPASLDPRSPRTHTFSSPATTDKHVQLVPPPIDTTAPRRSLPDDLVRTPYPFTPDRVHRKDLGEKMSPSPAVNPPLPVSESILTLSIHRTNRNSRSRVETITIPASNEFSAVRNSGQFAQEHHFKALDFDDEAFFQQLRLSYHKLCGMALYLSARSLRRINVSGPASKAADANYGWIHQPRSPRTLASKGLSDTFSEERILQHYRKPALGRSRYAFVHWAHRLASNPPDRTAQADGDQTEAVGRDLVRRAEQTEGLEFVVSWSIARISIAACIVVVLSITAMLLWIFLGHVTVASPPHGGFRDAGDRVVGGVVMGICILLVGLSGIAGWLGVSWLLM